MRDILRRAADGLSDVMVKRPRARIESTESGKVAVHIPKLGGEGASWELTPDQAEVIAQNLLMYAFVSCGNTPTEEHHRAVRQMRLR